MRALLSIGRISCVLGTLASGSRSQTHMVDMPHGTSLEPDRGLGSKEQVHTTVNIH